MYICSVFNNVGEIKRIKIKYRAKGGGVMQMQQIESSQKRTYTVEDIAKILKIGRTSAYSLIKQDLFSTVRIGSAIRISRKSFDEWLDSQD